MGLGKTITCLTALNELRIKTLVIAPKRVAEMTWGDEVKKWGFDFEVSVIKGNPTQRAAAMQKDALLYVIGVQNITEELLKLNVGMIILDELSLYKNSKTKRFRTLRKLTTTVERVVGLTGTPNPNSYMDLWSQIYLLDNGERLGRYKQNYIDKYFRIVGFVANNIPKYEPRRGADELIRHKISDICMSMRAEDYLELPAIVENVQKVNMDANQIKEYGHMVRENVANVNSKYPVLIESDMAMTTKCMQYANGFLYNEYLGNTETVDVHNAKIEKLQELVEHTEGNILLAYNYQEDLKRILAAFPNAVELKKSTDFEKWNRGEIKIGLLHPKSGGHGLNLQAGGNVVIWYAPTYSLEERLQFNARLHRQGQKGGVVVHTLVTQGTIDEIIMGVIRRKDKNQTILMKALTQHFETLKTNAI